MGKLVKVLQVREFSGAPFLSRVKGRFAGLASRPETFSLVRGLMHWVPSNPLIIRVPFFS